MALIDDLLGSRIALDTAPLIYWIEDHPDYAPILEDLFTNGHAARHMLFTSALTLLEVLVVPYRRADDVLAGRYEAALTAGDIDLVALDVDALRVAAWLRARFRVATPDAMQLACALASGCTTFVTNDRRLPDIPSLKVLQLADYLDAA